MAYIVPRRHSGTWEIRESRATPAGPRSRTLASFRTLTSEVVERAQGRSFKTLKPSELRRAAARVGAPVAVDAPDRAAVELLSELASGHTPRPVLRGLLLDALRGERREPSGNVQAAATWITATPQAHGEALRDLLLLTDRLPPSRVPRGRLLFPVFPGLRPGASTSEPVAPMEALSDVPPEKVLWEAA
jgi:hypothetical protein